MKQKIYTIEILPALFLFLLLSLTNANAQISHLIDNKNELQKDVRIRFYITAKRIVWQLDSTGKYLKNQEAIIPNTQTN